MNLAKPKNMKISLVYVYNQNGNGTRVDSVYLLPHTARARASKLRAQGWDSFVVKRSLRGNGTLFFSPESK